MHLEIGTVQTFIATKRNRISLCVHFGGTVYIAGAIPGLTDPPSTGCMGMQPGQRMQLVQNGEAVNLIPIGLTLDDPTNATATWYSKGKHMQTNYMHIDPVLTGMPEAPGTSTLLAPSPAIPDETESLDPGYVPDVGDRVEVHRYMEDGKVARLSAFITSRRKEAGRDIVSVIYHDARREDLHPDTVFTVLTPVHRQAPPTTDNHRSPSHNPEIARAYRRLALARNLSALGMQDAPREIMATLSERAGK